MKSSTDAWKRWGSALTFGIVLEFLLIAASVGEPEGGWLLIELHNVGMATHFPFFWFMATAEVESGFLSVAFFVLYEALLVLVWAFVYHWIRNRLRIQLARHSVSKGQKVVVVTTLFALALGGVAWEISDSYFDQKIPFAPSANLKVLAADNNAFALSLYQQLKEQPANLFFSPCSISTGLGMVYAGARGSTEREAAGVLQFHLPQTDLPPAFGELAARLNSLQHWNHLSLLPANSLWYQEKYAVTPAFISLIHANFRADVRPVDFEHSAPAACRELAGWIENKSRGRLKGAVNPSLIGQDTRLALCNTIYFKGEWASRFKRRNTQPRPFSIATNQTVTVPMMWQKATLKMSYVSCTNDLSLQLLELPYYGRDVSMVILLPRGVDALPELERQLTSENLRDWLTTLDETSAGETVVWLPHFTFTRTVDLKKELKGLGLTKLFSSDADLSGMESSTNLCLSDVLHQAFVEVNEQGTEATAMTLAIAKSKGMANRFLADHPFLFLIRENATGCILFLGRLIDPTKS